MKKESYTLHQIRALPEPRHLFVLPDWVDARVLDRLIREGYLTCQHDQRDEYGIIQVAMGLQLTAKGERLADDGHDWTQLALRASMAGASLVAMSIVILYIG
jgi:hypothetical protein